MMDLSTADFPVAVGHRRFRWAPVLFHPVQFSQDRLTIGVVVIDEKEANLLPANRLNKLECLFRGHSEAAVFAASVALDAMRARLNEGGIDAVTNFSSPVSGVELGEFRDVEAQTWTLAATRWLNATSALFEEMPDEVAVDMFDDEQLEVTPSVTKQSKERLSSLVLQYMRETNPRYAQYFSERVSKTKNRRPAHEPVIDYSGQRVVANFGTLFEARAQSVTNIKRRMWDLRIQMARESGSLITRNHEMIVHAPSKWDPRISTAQHKNLDKALDVLEEEADTQRIRLRPMSTVQEIGEHIIKLEAA